MLTFNFSNQRAFNFRVRLGRLKIKRAKINDRAFQRHQNNRPHLKFIEVNVFSQTRRGQN